MPLSRPTLTELVSRTESEMISRIDGVTAVPRRSTLRVLARVFAGAAHGQYGYNESLAEQILVTTAAGLWLEEHAIKWGIARKAATPAAGNVEFTGQEGTVISSGTRVQNADGDEYTTDALTTITGGVATAAVTAREGGADTNLAAGATVTLVFPIVGVDNEATVDSGGLTGGADQESDDALRDRVLERIQDPPRGGSEADYVYWVKQVESVQATRVWPISQHNGPGTVGVYFVMDNASPIIPSSANVVDVQAYIDTVRPVTAHPTVYAPTAADIYLDISLSPNISTVRDAVNDQLAALFIRRAEVNGTILLSHLNEAISVAAGEEDHLINEIYVDGAAQGVVDVTVDTGELPVFDQANMIYGAL